MKILSIATTHPRYQNDSEPAFVFNLNRELVKQGHLVTALLPHAAKAHTREVIDGIIIKRFRYFFPSSAQRLCYDGGILPNLKSSWLARINLSFFLFFQFFAVWRELKSQKYDIIHCHWLIPQGLILSLINTCIKVPFIASAHGSDVFTENFLFVVINRMVLKKCCICTVNSTLTKKKVKEIYPRAKTIIIPMGIDVHKFNPNKRSVAYKEKMGEGKPQLLFVGRFSETKGIVYLIRAMHSIIKRFDNAKLALIGFGPEEKKIKNEIVENNLQQSIKIIGKTSGNEIPSFIASADLFVLPSIQIEGLGVVILEAFACNTPVVASNVGGISDIVVDNETGLLCRERDVGDLADKCIRIIEDEKLRCKTIQNGRKMVEREFSWNYIAGKFENLFEYYRK